MCATYKQDFFVSWEELHRDTRQLCQMLLRDPAYPFEGIIAVTRGGLIPAAIVARELDIRLIDTVCIASYEGTEARERSENLRLIKPAAGDGQGMLLVDDLVDTGATATRLREMLPHATFATVYAKPEGRAQVDHCVRTVTQDTWIRFPWDMELSFAPPLIEQEQRHRPPTP
ncbi:xanthine phosphoribosyltransferase [Lujinxingia litoralis]|uniref:Xanthine phosphoribosyltransferase n=1 Tax=Lujinxingia litoralis TaxID=2211119 RepID=A0A328CA04_9DELT|nr:xanthine phosphoribosyltransferase [Lujinxingia litoralis]RAL22995.1 xanthine phosphoribosyltransferase [Lujinxingia litoralis]